MNKVYLLFEGECYYPAGGSLDYSGLYPTLKEAQDAFKPGRDTWANVASFDGSNFITVSCFGTGEVFKDLDWDEACWRRVDKVKAS